MEQNKFPSPYNAPFTPHNHLYTHYILCTPQQFSAHCAVNIRTYLA